jgi:hypothetical protein
VDWDGAVSTNPAAAPAELHSFDVDEFCGLLHVFDDGSAESYTYSPGEEGAGFRWAVRVSPVTTFYLCGLSFASGVTIPDEMHTPVYTAVRMADGPSGLPGTLVWEDTTGSIGNAPGGITPGTTHFANVVIRDDENLFTFTEDFYLIVGNIEAAKTESFGRDTTGLDSLVSFFFDPCDNQWYSEEAVHENARGGNRMIRALGYDLIAPVVTIQRQNSDVLLRWESTGAEHYDVYSALISGGPYSTLEGTTSDTTFVDVNGWATDDLKFYQVKSVSH